jgi:hypothetical protein
MECIVSVLLVAGGIMLFGERWVGCDLLSPLLVLQRQRQTTKEVM